MTACKIGFSTQILWFPAIQEVCPLEDPKRIRLIKNSLKTHQFIKYFEASENRLIDAEILELKRTKALVKNKHDGRRWIIPCYFINLNETDIDIHPSSGKNVSRNHLKVGDKVCFKDKEKNSVLAYDFLDGNFSYNSFYANSLLYDKSNRIVLADEASFRRYPT